VQLKDWCKEQDIAYQTGWKWFHAGKLPVRAIQTDTGMILVYPDKPAVERDQKAWVYARVSSHLKKDDLERQAERCVQFCASSGYTVEKVFKEVGSGMNDKRAQFWKLIDLKPTRVVVEHKDRLTRFGFNYLDQLLPKLGCEVVVINRDAVEETDLVKDLVSVITSFCCRLYGLRRGTNKAKSIRDTITLP